MKRQGGNYIDAPNLGSGESLAAPNNRLRLIQEYFKEAVDNWEPSHNEAQLVLDLYDDNQYDANQINELRQSGRPIETYNVIKKYTRNLVGYLSTVVTDIKIKPTSYDTIDFARRLDSTLQYILKQNLWTTLQDEINEQAALTGLTAFKYSILDTGKTDSVGRKITDIQLKLIPSKRILPDILDDSNDYSKARYTHEWEWLPYTEIQKLFGKRRAATLAKHGDNSIGMPLADIESNFLNISKGRFKQQDMYLIVRSVVRKPNSNKYIDTYWCGNHIIYETTIDYMPYRCFRLHKGKSKPEFYGIFREIIESQKAINQAVLQIQLLVNTNKVFVDENAVDDLDTFVTEYNRVNAVIPMLDLDGYRMENVNPNIVQQYHIIDSAIQRIQAILGINDSFLGLAAASDSGRKVQLQQNSSVVALRYFTRHIEHIYRTLGKDLITLAKRYFTAHRVMRLQDELGRDRWAEVNKPFMMPEDRLDYQGNIQWRPVLQPLLNDNGEFILNPDGAIQHKVINEPDTDISPDFDVDIEVKTAAYGESEEVERVILEAMINGNPGMTLNQANPVLYLRLNEIYAKTLKSEHSPEIVELFELAQQMLGGLPTEDPRQTAQGQGQGYNLGNISANTGKLTQAMGINNQYAPAGYNMKKG